MTDIRYTAAASGGSIRLDPGRLAATVVAVVFVLAGILGASADATRVAEDLYAVVHLAIGAFGLVMVRSRRGARTFLIAGGVVYVLWRYVGVLVVTEGAAPVSLSTASDWLNLGFSVSMVALACFIGSPSGPPSRRGEPRAELAEPSAAAPAGR